MFLRLRMQNITSGYKAFHPLKIENEFQSDDQIH